MNCSEVFLGPGKLFDHQPGYEPVTAGNISFSVVRGNSDTPIAFSEITGDITEYFLRINIRPHHVLSYRLHPEFKYHIKKGIFRKKVPEIFIQPAQYLMGATLRLSDEKHLELCLDFLRNLEAII